MLTVVVLIMHGVLVVLVGCCLSCSKILTFSKICVKEVRMFWIGNKREMVRRVKCYVPFSVKGELIITVQISSRNELIIARTVERGAVSASGIRKRFDPE